MAIAVTRIMQIGWHKNKNTLKAQKNVMFILKKRPATPH